MSIYNDTFFINTYNILKIYAYLYSDSYKSDILQSNALAIDSNCLSVGELFPVSKLLIAAFSKPVWEDNSLNEIFLLFLMPCNNSSNYQTSIHKNAKNITS